MVNDPRIKVILADCCDVCLSLAHDEDENKSCCLQHPEVEYSWHDAMELESRFLYACPDFVRILDA